MVNLYDNTSLNQTIEKIVYHGDTHAQTDWKFSSTDLKDKDFIRNNRDMLIRAMNIQWFKANFLPSLSDTDIQNAIGAGWLVQIKSAEGRAPWLQKSLNNGNIVYDFNKDKFSTNMYEKISGICDYFYSVCNMAIDKELNKEKPSINLSFLSTLQENNQKKYTTFAKLVELSDEWHKKIELKRVNRNKTEQDTREFMTFPDGHVVRQLLSTNALDIESDMMGHCVGNGSYDNGLKNGRLQIYSLRDADGIAHVTFEIDTKHRTIRQCKGQADSNPGRKYSKYIHEFIKKSGFKPEHDLNNMGLVRDNRNQIWDLYNLPETLEVDVLYLRHTNGVKIPNSLKCKVLDLIEAKNFTLPETLEVDELMTDADGIKMPNSLKCKRLDLSWAKNFTLPETLEVNELDLRYTNGVKIPNSLKCNLLNLEGAKKFTLPETLEVNETLYLEGAKNFTLPETLEVDELVLVDTNGVKIPNSLKCKRLNLHGAKNCTLPETLEVDELNLGYTDGVKIPNSLKCKRLYLHGAKNTCLRKNYFKSTANKIKEKIGTLLHNATQKNNNTK